MICIESFSVEKKDDSSFYFHFIMSCESNSDKVQNLNCKLHQKSETTFEASKRHQLSSVWEEEVKVLSVCDGLLEKFHESERNVAQIR